MTVNIDLAGICNQFASVGFYEGIVELCLATAAEQDNQNLAVHLTHTGGFCLFVCLSVCLSVVIHPNSTGTVAALSWHCGGTLAALWRHSRGTVAALSWHCGGTLAALWRHSRGTLAALSWHPRGTLVALSWHSRVYRLLCLLSAD